MISMGSATRILLSLVLVLTVGLSACGRRGSLERPEARYPEVAADPSTKQSQAPDRRIPILDDIIH
jgi:predicted small lipoprotein YifL